MSKTVLILFNTNTEFASHSWINLKGRGQNEDVKRTYKSILQNNIHIQPSLVPKNSRETMPLTSVISFTYFACDVQDVDLRVNQH